MLVKSVHPIIAIHCDTRYIDTFKVVSIQVSYCDTAMHRCIIPSLVGSETKTFFPGINRDTA